MELRCWPSVADDVETTARIGTRRPKATPRGPICLAVFEPLWFGGLAELLDDVAFPMKCVRFSLIISVFAINHRPAQFQQSAVLEAGSGS